MKTESEILARIAEVKRDDRLTYPPAMVAINAPLAMIQLGLETKLNTLEWVVGLPLSKFPLRRRKK